MEFFRGKVKTPRAEALITRVYTQASEVSFSSAVWSRYATGKVKRARCVTRPNNNCDISNPSINRAQKHTIYGHFLCLRGLISSVKRPKA